MRQISINYFSPREVIQEIAEWAETWDDGIKGEIPFHF